jgi:hypothetical protein
MYERKLKEVRGEILDYLRSDGSTEEDGVYKQYK